MGDIKIKGRVIETLQDLINWLMVTGRNYGLEIKESEVMKISGRDNHCGLLWDTNQEQKNAD